MGKKVGFTAAQSLIKNPKDAKKPLYKGEKKSTVQVEKSALA
jgi:hypothetical protein